MGARQPENRNGLTFDAEPHEYRYNGRVVPSVTKVLSVLPNKLGFVDADTLEEARLRGIAVHRMVELHCKGELGEVPEWMQPIYARYLQFEAETRFEMIRSEYRVYHAVCDYAGTLDLFGYVHGEAAFIDVKRSFLAGAAIRMQIAAYHEAYCEQEKVGKSAKRYALKLNENGPYRLEEFKNQRNDWCDFLTCLNFFRLKARLQ